RPADHERGRGGRGQQRRHELLPRHRQYEARAGRRLRGTLNGGNHPITGTTVICDGVWYHVAATFDGATWRLYVNGVQDAQLSVTGFTPRSDSIQHAGLGVALSSLGVATGAFNGTMDEVRIWNVARTSAQIQGAMAA